MTIPKDERIPEDKLDQAIEDMPFIFIGHETCECGINHTIYAPVPVGMAECVCGLLLEFNLEEYDAD